MKIIFKILCTFATTVTIVAAKNLNLWPFLGLNFGTLFIWLNHIEDNRNPVFIGFAYDSYVCIGSKGSYRAKSFDADLARLEHRQRTLRLTFLQVLRDCGFDAL